MKRRTNVISGVALLAAAVVAAAVLMARAQSSQPAAEPYKTRAMQAYQTVTAQAANELLYGTPTVSPYLTYVVGVTQIPGVNPQGTPDAPLVGTFAVIMPPPDPSRPISTRLPPHTILVAGQVITVDPSFLILESRIREDYGCSPAPNNLLGKQYVLTKRDSLSILTISSENGDYRIEVRPGDEGVFDDVLPHLRNKLKNPSS